MTDDAPPTDYAEDDDDPEDDGQGAAALDLAVNTIAGAAAAAAGYALGGPAGAVLGNAAAPYLAALFQRAVEPLWADRVRRAEKMMEAAAEATGLPPEELADRAAESEKARFLTDKAVKAATNTMWPEGIRAIGRAYAAGLLAKDKTVIDGRLRAIGIMEDLDELHVRLLDLLVRYEPGVDQDEGAHLAVHSRPYVNTAGSKVWYASLGWKTEQIRAVMPEIQPVLSNLLGELRESGLAQENDTAPDVARQLRDHLTEQINNHAEQMQRTQGVRPIKLKMRRFRRAYPTWSPTELGEKVLGFYAEAGAEDSQNPGGHPGPESGC
jgi:hypothetical protein